MRSNFPLIAAAAVENDLGVFVRQDSACERDFQRAGEIERALVNGVALGAIGNGEFGRGGFRRLFAGWICGRGVGGSCDCRRKCDERGRARVHQLCG